MGTTTTRGDEPASVPPPEDVDPEILAKDREFKKKLKRMTPDFTSDESRFAFIRGKRAYRDERLAALDHFLRSDEFQSGNRPLRFRNILDFQAYRIWRHQNTNVYVEGPQGEGKSSFSACLCEILDYGAGDFFDDVRLRKCVVLGDLIHKFHGALQMAKMGEPDTVVRGSYLMLDEAEQTMGSGGAYAGVRELKKTFKWSRKYELNVLANSPRTAIGDLYYEEFHIAVKVTGAYSPKAVIFADTFVTLTYNGRDDFINPICVERRFRGHTRPRCDSCKYRRDDYRRKVGRWGELRCPRGKAGAPVEMPFCPSPIWALLESDKDESNADGCERSLQRMTRLYKEQKARGGGDTTNCIRQNAFVTKKHEEKYGGRVEDYRAPEYRREI